MRCVVLGCKSIHKLTKDVMFHSFPKDPELRATWLGIITLKGKFYECARICSLHFKPDQYEMSKRLKKNAVPFYCPTARDCDHEKTSESTAQPHCLEDHASKENLPQNVVNSPILHYTASTSALEPSLEVNANMDSNSSELAQPQNVLSAPILHFTDSTSLEPIVEVIVDMDSNSSEPVQLQNVSSAPILQSILNAPIHHPTMSILVNPLGSKLGCSKKSKPAQMSHSKVPAVKRLRMSNANIQVKLKTDREQALLKTNRILLQKVEKQKLQICKLKSLVDVVRDYTSQSEIENIINGKFSKICKLFNQREKKQKGIRLSKEAKEFLLTMHRYSPKAYEYLRTIISLPLPVKARKRTLPVKARKRKLPVVQKI